MTERTIDELIRALRQGDGDARQQAVEALAAMGQGAVEPLIDALRSFATYEAYAASEITTNFFHAAEQALIEIGSAAVSPLAQALGEESWGAVHGAIYCLGEIGDVRAVQPLIETLDKDDVNVTTDVGEVLLRFEEMALRPLIYALQQQGAAGRRGAAFILGSARDPLATPSLIEALNDADANVRAAAANALGQRKDARAIEPLIALQADEEPAVREAAMRALGEIGQALESPQIDRALVQGLYDRDWGTRQSAAEMLIRLDSPYAESARWTLLCDLQQQDVEVQLGAAWSLLPTKDHQAVVTLEELLTAADVRVSSSAALALGEYEDRRAVPALTALLDHADEQVRHAAQAALRKLGADPDGDSQNDTGLA